MSDVELRSAYLISGGDSPKIETAVARLRAHFTPESVELVSAVDCRAPMSWRSCNSGSLFGDRRLVVVDEVDGRPNADGQLRNGWKAADAQASSATSGAPAPETVLALVARAMKRDGPLAKAVGREGLLVYDVAKRALGQWVADRFREQGVRAEPDACSALLHLVGDDVSELAREIEKIATWADGSRSASGRSRRSSQPLPDTPVFRISDAWGQRDVTALLEATESMLERSGRRCSATVPIVAGALGRQVAIVRRAKLAEDRGTKPREAMKELGVRFEFEAERAFQFGRNYSDGELEDAPCPPGGAGPCDQGR